MNVSNKRILVIGGGGLIGSHIVDELLRKDIKEVIIYDNFSRGNIRNLTKALKNPRCKIFKEGQDILHADSLNMAMNNIDGVFHLAAASLLICHMFPSTGFEVNVKGTFNVIMSAIKNKVKKIVYSSSASVYGDALTNTISEDHPYNNFTLYGASKIAGEHFFKSLGHNYKFDWIGLRYMNVYGPRMDYKGIYNCVMHKILDKIESNKKPIVYGDGSQCYDFIHVQDVAKANILAMESEISGQCYNVGRGIGTSIKELTQMMLKLTNSNLDIQYEPSGLTFVTNRIGCPKAAKKDLNFEWAIDLPQGLENFIEWRKNDKQLTNC